MQLLEGSAGKGSAASTGSLHAHVRPHGAHTNVLTGHSQRAQSFAGGEAVRPRTSRVTRMSSFLRHPDYTCSVIPILYRPPLLRDRRSCSKSRSTSILSSLATKLLQRSPFRLLRRGRQLLGYRFIAFHGMIKFDLNVRAENYRGAEPL